MKTKRHAKLLSALAISLVVIVAVVNDAVADKIEDPCTGPEELLSIVDRPTIQNSPCVVPFNKALIELGYQYLNLRGGGNAQNYPEANFRLGLPWKTEVSVLLPNYIHQSIIPHSGNAATVLGIKHQIGYTKDLIGTVEGIFTLPSGSRDFGSDGLGTAFNGIVSYKATSTVTFTLQCGVTSLTQSIADGGRRYTSFNPDLVMDWAPVKRLQFFGEIYGQTNTGPGQGGGVNMDAGIQYLLTRYLVVDVEVGQRISGQLGNFNNYIGSGLGIELEAV